MINERIKIMLYYDEGIFQAFRAKAVTSVDQLILGKRYYLNNGDTSFILVGIIADAQQRQMDGLLEINDPNQNKLNWIIRDDGRLHSLKDLNIGASCNPWLIFENEQDALDCIQQLIISYEHDYY